MFGRELDGERRGAKETKEREVVAIIGEARLTALAARSDRESVLTARNDILRSE